MRKRKPKITSEMLKEIIKMVGYGLNLEDSCYHVGISDDTVHNVFKHSNKYVENIPDIEKLKVDFREAKNAAKLFHIKNIYKKAEEHPNLSTWWLERCFPDEFGKRDRQVISTEDDKPFVLKVVLDKNSEDEG